MKFPFSRTLSKAYNSAKDWLLSEDPIWDPDKVECYVDDEKEDCFIGKIEALGYKYDDGNDWYERTWSTDSGPKETIREVYQLLENGRWNKIMIGYGDRVFFEEPVDEVSHSRETHRHDVL